MNLILVDDDAIVSAALKTILETDPEIQVLAVGHNGNEAVSLHKKYKPDIALLDIQMPEKTGLEAAKEILSDDADAKILFLTTFSDNEFIVQALHIGAKGYILKQDFASVATALKAVVSGQNVFGADIVSKLPTLLHNAKGIDYKEFGISEKEEQIITLVAEGLNNKEISKELFLSDGTVQNYVSTILSKLGLRDRTQLAIFYYQNR